MTQSKKLVFTMGLRPDSVRVLVEGQECEVRYRLLRRLGPFGVYECDFTRVDRVFDACYRNSGELPVVKTPDGETVFPAYK